MQFYDEIMPKTDKFNVMKFYLLHVPPFQKIALNSFTNFVAYVVHMHLSHCTVFKMFLRLMMIFKLFKCQIKTTTDYYR